MNDALPRSLAEPLVTPAALTDPAFTGGLPVCIADCRADLGDPEAGRRRFEAAHLPGSVHLDLNGVLSGPITPGRSGRHPLPAAEQLRADFAAAGIDADAPVVFLDDGDGAFAARGWWLACWLGHPHAHVLDGGSKRWEAEGFDVERGPVANPVRAATWPERAALLPSADASDVLGAIAANTPIVDARAAQRFEGIAEPIDPVAGHIPGARCLPHAGNVDRDGRFLDRDALAERWTGALGSDPAHAISYCGSGVTAAHNVLSIVAAGLPAPRLYVGSWSEWITDPERPVATGPGR